MDVSASAPVTAEAALIGTVDLPTCNGAMTSPTSYANMLTSTQPSRGDPLPAVSAFFQVLTGAIQQRQQQAMQGIASMPSPSSREQHQQHPLSFSTSSAPRGFSAAAGTVTGNEDVTASCATNFTAATTATASGGNDSTQPGDDTARSLTLTTTTTPANVSTALLNDGDYEDLVQHLRSHSSASREVEGDTGAEFLNSERFHRLLASTGAEESECDTASYHGDTDRSTVSATITTAAADTKDSGGSNSSSGNSASVLELFMSAIQHISSNPSATTTAAPPLAALYESMRIPSCGDGGGVAAASPAMVLHEQQHQQQQHRQYQCHQSSSGTTGAATHPPQRGLGTTYPMAPMQLRSGGSISSACNSKSNANGNAIPATTLNHASNPLGGGVVPAPQAHSSQGVLTAASADSATSMTASPRTTSTVTPAAAIGKAPADALASSSGQLVAAAQTYNGEAAAVHERVDAAGCITVVDPQRRKIRVPASAIERTKGLNGRLTTPSLCLLFQSGRCRQGGNCYQVHADPRVVQQLRVEAELRPCCCAVHGDANAALWQDQEAGGDRTSGIGATGTPRHEDALPPLLASQMAQLAVAITLPVSPSSPGGGMGAAGSSMESAANMAVQVNSSCVNANNNNNNNSSNGNSSNSAGGRFVVPLLRTAYTVGLARMLRAHGLGGPTAVVRSSASGPHLVPALPVSPTALCRLHGQPNGCRFGADCKFVHVCRSILQGELTPLMSAVNAATTATTNEGGSGSATGNGWFHANGTVSMGSTMGSFSSLQPALAGGLDATLVSTTSSFSASRGGITGASLSGGFPPFATLPMGTAGTSPAAGNGGGHGGTPSGDSGMGKQTAGSTIVPFVFGGAVSSDFTVVRAQPSSAGLSVVDQGAFSTPSMQGSPMLVSVSPGSGRLAGGRGGNSPVVLSYATPTMSYAPPTQFQPQPQPQHQAQYYQPQPQYSQQQPSGPYILVSSPHQQTPQMMSPSHQYLQQQQQQVTYAAPTGGRSGSGSAATMCGMFSSGPAVVGHPLGQPYIPSPSSPMQLQPSPPHHLQPQSQAWGQQQQQQQQISGGGGGSNLYVHSVNANGGITVVPVAGFLPAGGQV